MTVPNVPVIYPDDEVLALSEAAAELRLSKQALIYAHLRGDLAMREASNRFLIRRQDLEAFKRLRVQRARRRKGTSA